MSSEELRHRLHGRILRWRLVSWRILRERVRRHGEQQTEPRRHD
jgi:hypothetical protein